jgi:hypothetical protein
VSVSLLSIDQEEFVEAVALRVVQLLEERDRDRQPAGLVDAATLGRLFGVSRTTIYEYADVLGGVELAGEGKRTLLRFDVEKARAAWTRRDERERSQAESALPKRDPRRRPRAAARSTATLLPVKA